MQKDKEFTIEFITLEAFASLSFDTPLHCILESGGTKTDWRIISDDKIYGFKTIQFHPNRLNEEHIEIIKLITNIIPQNSSLHFYGSGCLQNEQKEKITRLFSPISFKEIKIDSDLLAAGKSVYGSNDGYVAILGTGSVLFNFKENQLTDIHGGFGYLLGDEGSGYYFGKLALQHYLHQQGSNEFNNLFEKLYGSKQTIINNVYQNTGKEFISHIQLTSNNTVLQEEINSLHQKNIELFFDLYLPKSCEKIGFVGSYAFYNQELIKSILKRRKIQWVDFVQYPVDALVKEHFTNEI
jgi:glucosamine kinase